MSSAHLKSRLSLPTSRWQRALVMVAALTLATGAGFLVPSFAPQMGGWLVGGVGFGCLFAISVLFLNKAWEVKDTYLFKTLTVTAICAALLTVVFSTSAALALDVAITGTRHTVIVTAERRVNHWFSIPDDYHYQISVNGRTLAGELIIGSDDLDPGDIIEVYSGPADDSHELAGSVEAGPTMAVLAGIGYLISLPLCCATGYFAPLSAFQDPRRSQTRKRTLTRKLTRR